MQNCKPNLKQVSQSISRMMDMVDLTKAQYPFMPITFSIWRREKYQELKDLFPHSLDDLTLEFHNLIDKDLLPLFIARVKEGIKESFRQLRAPSSTKLKEFQEGPEYQALIIEYIEAATSQLFRLEIFADLMTWPYGINTSQSYYLRREFTDCEEQIDKGIVSKLVTKHGQTMVNKGVGVMGKEMWGRLAIGIVGGFNVLGLAGGVLLGKVVDTAFIRMNRKKRLQKLSQEIKMFNRNACILSDCIQICTDLSDRYIASTDLTLRWQLESQFKKQIQRVFVLDSEESVVICDQQQGCKSVSFIESDEEFQQIVDMEQQASQH